MPGRLSRAARGESPGAHLVWVLVVCLLVGGLGALLWVWWWTPPQGVVVDGEVLTFGAQAARSFDAVGTFVLVGAVLGLATGALLGLLARRNELLTLGAATVGGLLAATLMGRLGPALGPPDPAPIAARSDDLTRLTMALEDPGVVAHLALPAGLVAGLLLALVLVPTTGRERVPDTATVGTLPS